MPKASNINVSVEDKATFVKICAKKQIHQIRMTEVLISMLGGEEIFGTLKLDWKKIQEHFPKTEQENHVFEIIIKMLKTSDCLTFGTVYEYIQEGLGLMYSQAQINFVVEDYYCKGKLWVDVSSGEIYPGRGKRSKKRNGGADKARWKSDWEAFVGKENVRDMRKRLGVD